jgi:hypothetical protein
LRSRVRDSSPAPVWKGSLPASFFIAEDWLEYFFSRLSCTQHVFDFAVTIRTRGGVAKWLCSGLQSRLRRFDPDPRLQFSKKRRRRFFYTTCFKIALSPSGEIGRHSGLKIRRLPEKGRTGSIPVSGTKYFFISSHTSQTRMFLSIAGFLLSKPFQTVA